MMTWKLELHRFFKLALKNGTVPDGLIAHAHSDNASVLLVNLALNIKQQFLVLQVK